MSGCKDVARFFAVVGFFFSTFQFRSSTSLRNVSPTFHSFKHLTKSQKLLDNSGKTEELEDSLKFEHLGLAEVIHTMLDPNIGTHRKDGDWKSDELTSRRKWKDEQLKRRWGDNSTAVWRKRGNTSRYKINGPDVNTNVQHFNFLRVDEDKRRWRDNSMSAWGKRDNGDKEKRRWSDNSMRVWGKRWYDSDSLVEKENEIGHKRTLDNFQRAKEKEETKDDLDERFQMTEMKKKNEKRKRSILDNADKGFKLMSDIVKRRWSSNSPSSGNKYRGTKRNWEKNTMKVWGKRGLASKNVPRVWRNRNFDSTDENVNRKRLWTSDNTIRIWGKKRNSMKSKNQSDNTWNDMHIGSLRSQMNFNHPRI